MPVLVSYKVVGNVCAVQRQSLQIASINSLIIATFIIKFFAKLNAPCMICEHNTVAQISE